MASDLNLVRQGAGPPVVFLHPVGLDLSCWGAVADQLQSDFEVIRIDLPGHGQSPPPAPDATLDDYAESVADAIGSLGLGRVDIVGLSFGGMIAQTLAIRHPEVCSALVIAACPCTFADPDRPLRAERGRLASERGMAAVAETTLERWFDADFIAAGGAEPTRQTLLRHSAESWRIAWNAISRLHTQPLLATLTAPTCCVAGGADRASCLEAVKAIADAIPGAEFAVLPGAPHMMQIQCPHDFSLTVAGFLNRYFA